MTSEDEEEQEEEDGSDSDDETQTLPAESADALDTLADLLLNIESPGRCRDLAGYQVVRSLYSLGGNLTPSSPACADCRFICMWLCRQVGHVSWSPSEGAGPGSAATDPTAGRSVAAALPASTLWQGRTEVVGPAGQKDWADRPLTACMLQSGYGCPTLIAWPASKAACALLRISCAFDILFKINP